ncbi:MAG: amidohydrolase family protein [Deltaproteobacteria bacterium]|jgi:imidazolonepropionase-like amidohydrolase|nr:amidohydrolase family protein [Deltaproteobacteria bacterium]MBW2541553.1 amidohydrolase family protein [Deltaproteobacteria bacterium]
MNRFSRFALHAGSLLFFLAPPVAEAQWSKPEQGDLFIHGGWLFDSVSDGRRRNSGISIRNGKIVEVDADARQHRQTAVTKIELEDSDTILPGMLDLHAHYNLDLVDKGRVEEVAYNGLLFLANGVTSTWSAGEFYPERVIAQRDLIDAGRAIGPRLFVSGPYFGAFRCEYSIKTAADDCIGWPNDITEEEIRREVDKWAERGVISIKIKQATPGEVKILIEQAHENGMTTVGHLANYDVEYDVDLRDAILMGMDRVEHQLTLGSGGPRSAEMQQMVELMLAHQVYYDANLQMYGGIDLRQKHASEMIWADEAKYFTPYAQSLLEKRGPPSPESDEAEYAQRVLELKTLFEAGGGHLLVVGTDEPVYTDLLPGFAYHRELLALTYAGIPPAAVLKAATINGARALGVAEKLGSVEVGKLADLLVVKGNPLADIKSARSIRYVIKAGYVHDPEALLRSAQGKIGPAGPDDHANWELQLKPLR